MNPLVSVICVCYNHGRFVKEAIESVLNQSYTNIELIVVDDASSDNSVAVIQSLNVRLIANQTNKGYCAAFNEGWRASKGEYIIDLAADDVLMPDRVKIGVDEFLFTYKYDGESFAVQYGDAQYIDENGNHLYKHSDKHSPRRAGYTYAELIRRYFICSASMMSRRSVLTKLNGYDESLAYEDFDFWIRSSRDFSYFYNPAIMVKKRIVKGSLKDKQFVKGSPQQLSTYKVCEKILSLNKDEYEHKALKERLWYELRQCLRRFDFSLAKRYLRLIRNTQLLIDKMHQPGRTDQ